MNRQRLMTNESAQVLMDITELCRQYKAGGIAESRYEIIINRRGAEDAEEKERASFYYSCLNYATPIYQ